MEELKDVLKRVSGKILAVEKICIAMNFQIWTVIMAGYYVLIAPLDRVPLWLTIAYWSFGAVVFAYASKSLWRKVSMLISEGGSGKVNFGIFLSWVIAALFGWFFVPSMIGGYFLQRLAVGLLSFISTAVIGMIATIYFWAKKLEVEMVPAFLIPALAIPLVYLSKNPMDFAGMTIVLGYGTIVILYTIRAFKVA